MSALIWSPAEAGFDAIAAAWQRRRAVLAHDRLRNRLLPRLHACVALLDGELDASPELIRRFHGAIDEWPACAEEAFRIADDCVDAMSPLRTVDAIAIRWPAELTSFVRAVTLELWNRRYGVPNQVGAIRAAATAATAAYEAWVRTHDPEALRTLATEVARLSRTLSALPARITL